MSLSILPDAGAIWRAFLGLAVGGAAGLAYFGLLWRNVRLFAQGRPVVAAATAIARFGGLALVLAVLSCMGAAPLAAALVGVVIAREIVKRRIGEAP